MKFKKDEEGKLELDANGDPIAVDEKGETIPLDKVVSLGKHQRVVDELEATKTSLKELETQVGDLQKSAGSAEDLKAKVEELNGSIETSRTEFETKLAEKDKAYALDTALLAAGVPAERLKAAKALIDVEKVELSNGQLTGFDSESFKKDNGYLFGEVKTYKTGAPPAGPPSKDDENDAQTRRAMGLPEPKADTKE